MKIHQKTGYKVALMVFLGFFASPTMMAICSPLPKLKSASTKALAMPLLPFFKAPGFFQYVTTSGPPGAAICHDE